MSTIVLVLQPGELFRVVKKTKNISSTFIKQAYSSLIDTFKGKPITESKFIQLSTHQVVEINVLLKL